MVWISTDVHYSAAHRYTPCVGQFTDFDPLWVFVAGPLNAGTFEQKELDNTFGPEVKFASSPKMLKANRPPSEGMQFFGSIRIHGTSRVMTVGLRNLAGEIVYTVDLPPAGRASHRKT